MINIVKCCYQDTYIGRKIAKLTGTASASNYIMLPDPKSGVKSMELTGRYVSNFFIEHINRCTLSCKQFKINTSQFISNLQ